MFARRAAVPRRQVLLSLSIAVAAACSPGSGRTRDISGDPGERARARNGDSDAGTVSGVPPPPPAGELTTPKADRPHVVAKASARAIALDDRNVYYGDSDDDGVYALPRAGGDVTRIARHAPVAGALALEGTFVTWIASPGDAVLRASVAGGAQPTTLRDHGIFSDVAASGDDVFITEAVGAGGALLRVNGATTSRVATFDGAPRVVMADKTYAFVVTPSKIVRVLRQHGEVTTVATGTRFTHADLDDGFVYVLGEVERTRALVRFPKAGGDPAVLARDVRDAPIKVQGGEVLYFDGARPQLRAVRTSGGEPRVLVDDEGLGTVSAIEADATTILVAEGIHESGAIVSIARAHLENAASP